MTAIRSVRASEGKFVQISNAALQDKRLSWSARGILAFVLSMPPDQRFTAQWLEDQSPSGREMVRSALRELKACGYFRSTKRSLGRGHWEWDQVISDALIPDDDHSGNGMFSQVISYDGNPSDEDPSNVNPSDEPVSQEGLFPQDSSSDGKSSDEDPSNKRSKTDTPKTKPSASQKGGRATRIPAGFGVSSDMQAWAAVRCPDVDTSLETEIFVNYWQAKGGSSAAKLDWILTWRNWMLKAEQQAPQRTRAPRSNSRGNYSEEAHDDEWPTERSA